MRSNQAAAAQPHTTLTMGKDTPLGEPTVTYVNSLYLPAMAIGKAHSACGNSLPNCHGLDRTVHAHQQPAQVSALGGQGAASSRCLLRRRAVRKRQALRVLGGNSPCCAVLCAGAPPSLQHTVAAPYTSTLPGSKVRPGPHNLAALAALQRGMLHSLLAAQVRGGRAVGLPLENLHAEVQGYLLYISCVGKREGKCKLLLVCVSLKRRGAPLHPSPFPPKTPRPPPYTLKPQGPVAVCTGQQRQHGPAVRRRLPGDPGESRRPTAPRQAQALLPQPPAAPRSGAAGAPRAALTPVF
jgi:hypothetical protein